MDGSHQPSISYFKVLINNNIYSSNSIAVSGYTVSLTLAKPVSSTDTVTVTYADPTAGNDTYALQDLAGNDAASLASHAVTNQTLDTSGAVFTFRTIGFTQTSNADVVLTFTKGIQAANAMAGWTLLKDGTTSVTITSATLIGNTLTLHTNATLAATDYLKITYSGGSLTDNFGNSFNDSFNARFIGGSDDNTLNLSQLDGYSSSHWWVNSGGGNDILTGGYNAETLAGSSGADTIYGGGGGDKIYLTEGTAATDTVVIGYDGWVNGAEMMYDFDVSNAGGTYNDRLNLPSGTIAANATLVDGIDVSNLAKHSICNGILTFLDSSGNPVLINSGNTGNALNYLALNITTPGTTVAVAADTDGNGTNDSLGVFQHGAWNEDAFAVVYGINGVTLGNTAGQNVVQIVDTTPPEISGVSFSGTSISLEYSENITFISGAVHNPILLNGSTPLTVSNAATHDNVLTLTTDHTFAATDWILLTMAADIEDTFGNITIAGQKGAIGGDGNNTINMSSSPDSLIISGQDGNDILTASNFGCELAGGKGADTMIGGAGADDFHFYQGDSTAALFIDNNLDSTLDAGDTFIFTGGVDVVNGFSGSDVVHLSVNGNNRSLSNMAVPANGLTIDQRYFLVQGSLSGSTFTAGGGSDTLVIYDGNNTAGVSQTGLVISGVAPSSLTTNGNYISHV